MTSTDAVGTDAAPDAPALGAAKAPRGAGAAPLVAQLIALGWVALGVVALREALLRTDAVTGESWVGVALREVDGTPYDAVAVLVVGVLAVLLGLVVLPTALRRRPRTSVPLATSTGVFLRNTDVGRVMLSALEGADSVTETSVRARKRTVRVRGTTYAPKREAPAVRAEVVDRLAPVVDALHHRPRVKVRLRHQGDDR